MKLRITPLDREGTYVGIVEIKLATFSSYIDALDVDMADAEIRALHNLLGTYLNAKVTERIQPYSSPCPLGYNTVVGWLARNEPEMIHNCDPKWDTTRDGWWLKHRCKERGLSVYKVPAPKALQDRGIAEVNAYPEALIAERFAA